MISAIEALALPSAQLTAEELAAADKLEADIDKYVRGHMERRGVEFAGEEKNSNVIAEVNQRLKKAGYTPSIQFLVERHKLNAAQQEIVGFRMMLPPSDESYREASRAALS